MDTMKFESDPDFRSPDWIESVLREDAKEHAASYVHDEGFTARVMDTLPAPVAAPRWRKPALVTMWAAAAAGAAIALPEVAIGVGREAFRLFAAQPVSLPQIGAALVLLGLASWSAAAYALRSE
jgi:hypothetical protein